MQSQADNTKIRLDVQANTLPVEQMNSQLKATKAVAETSAFALNKFSAAAKSNVVPLAQMTNGLNASATAAEAFANQMGLAARRFGAFVVAGGAIVNVITGFKAGLAAAIEFDREMIRLRQVSSETAAEIAGIQDEITRLAKNFGVSSAELSKSASIFKQAGFTINDTRIALETLAKTSLAPNFDNMASSTEGMIAVLKQFNLGAKDLESTFGSINAVASGFAVEARDIIDAVKKAGGAFAQTGGTLNEFIALFSSVRSTTREGANEIATGLRTIFTRVQRTDTVEALHELGVNLRYTADEAKNLGDVKLEQQFVGPYEAVARLNEALSKLRTTDPRYSAIIEELGGFRQVSRVIPLIQQFGEAQKALAVAQSGQISLSIAAEQAQSALQVQTHKVKEEYLEFFRTLTQSEGFKALAQGALFLASSLAKILDVAQPLLPILTALTISKALTNVTSLVQGGSNVISQFVAGASGRGARRYATGGRVPGYGGGDTVPAVLEPGEYVLPKHVASGIGYRNLQKMADGGPIRLPGGFATLLNPEDSYRDLSDKYGNNISNFAGLQPFLKQLEESRNNQTFGQSAYGGLNIWRAGPGFYGNRDRRPLSNNLRDNIAVLSDYLEENGLSQYSEIGRKLFENPRATVPAANYFLEVLQRQHARSKFRSIADVDISSDKSLPLGSDTYDGTITLPLGEGHNFNKIGQPFRFVNTASFFKPRSKYGILRGFNKSGHGLITQLSRYHFFDSGPYRENGFGRHYDESYDNNLSFMHGLPTVDYTAGLSKYGITDSDLINTFSGLGETDRLLGRPRQRFASGGPVHFGDSGDPILLGGQTPVKMARGGRVPGHGFTDSVPALLMPGEYVLNKEATAELGPARLNRMNKKGGIGDGLHYATGGRVINKLKDDDFQNLFKIIGGEQNYDSFIQKQLLIYGKSGLDESDIAFAALRAVKNYPKGSLASLDPDALLKDFQSKISTAIRGQISSEAKTKAGKETSLFNAEGKVIAGSSKEPSASDQAAFNEELKARAIHEANRQAAVNVSFDETYEQAKRLKKTKDQPAKLGNIADRLRARKATPTSTTITAPVSTPIVAPIVPPIPASTGLTGRLPLDVLQGPVGLPIVKNPRLDLVEQLSNLGVNVEGGINNPLDTNALRQFAQLRQQLPKQYLDLLKQSGATQTLTTGDIYQGTTRVAGIANNTKGVPTGSRISPVSVLKDVNKISAGPVSFHEDAHALDKLFGNLSQQKEFIQLHKLASQNIQANPGNIKKDYLKVISGKPSETFAESFARYHGGNREQLPPEIQQYFAQLEAGGGKIPPPAPPIATAAPQPEPNRGPTSLAIRPSTGIDLRRPTDIVPSGYFTSPNVKVLGANNTGPGVLIPPKALPPYIPQPGTQFNPETFPTGEDKPILSAADRLKAGNFGKTFYPQENLPNGNAANSYLSVLSERAKNTFNSKVAGRGGEDALSQITKFNIEQASVSAEKIKLDREFISAQSNLLKITNPLLSATERRLQAEYDLARVEQGLIGVSRNKAGGVIGAEDTVTGLPTGVSAPGASSSLRQRFGVLPRGSGIRNQINSFYESRGGAQLQNALLFGLPFIGQAIEKQGGSVQEAALSRRNENVYSGTHAVAGFLSGASIGSFIGGTAGAPLGVGAGVGAAAGALVGGIIGVISSLKEAERDIRQVKINNALTDFADKLNSIANLGTETSSTVKDAALKQLNTTLKESNERSRDAATHTFGGFDINEYLQIQQKNIRSELGPQLGDITKSIFKQADQLGKASPGGRPEDILNQLQTLDNGLNKELLQLIANVRQVPLAQVLKETTDQIKASQRVGAAQESREKAGGQEVRNVNEFGRLIDSLQSASDSLRGLRDISSALSDSFEGVVASTKVNLNPAALKRLGTPGDVALEPLRALSLVGGDEGKRLYSAGQQANAVEQALPAILTQLTQKQGVADQDISTQAGQLLRAQFGGSNDAINTVVSRLREVNATKPAEAQRRVGLDVVGFSKELIKPFSEPIREAGTRASQLLQEEANRFIDGLVIIRQKVNAIGLEQDRLQNIRLTGQRIQADIIADRTGNRRSALDLLSLQQLQAPLAFRQERLTGNVGIGENPAAIGAALEQTQKDIEAAVTKQATVAQTSGTKGKEFEQAVRELVNLKDRASNLQNALRNLSDVAERNAAIQEKLNQIEQDRQGRLSLGERYLTGGPEEVNALNRGALLANQANNLDLSGKGGLQNFSSEDIKDLLGFLRSAGNAKLTGFQGAPNAADLADRLVTNAFGGAFGLDKNTANTKTQLQNAQLGNAQKGEDALSILVRIQSEFPDKLLNTLKTEREQFFTRLEAFFAQDRIQNKQTEAGVIAKNLSELKQKQPIVGQLNAAGINTSKDVEKALSIRGDIKSYIDKKAELDAAYNLSSNVSKNVGNISDQQLYSSGYDNLLKFLTGQGVEVKQAGNIVANYSKRVSESDNLGEFNNLSEQTINGQGSVRDLLKTELINAIRDEFNNGATTTDLNNELSNARKKIEASGFNPASFNTAATGENPGQKFISILDSFDPSKASTKLEDFATALDATTRKLQDLNTQVLQGNAKYNPAQVGRQVLSTVGPLGFAGLGFAGGGVARGTDTIPAMLTPGEFIVNKDSAAANRGLLHQINAAKGGIKYYFQGGPVDEGSEALQGLLDSEFGKDKIDYKRSLKERYRNGTINEDDREYLRDYIRFLRTQIRFEAGRVAKAIIPGARANIEDDVITLKNVGSPTTGVWGGINKVINSENISTIGPPTDVEKNLGDISNIQGAKTLTPSPIVSGIDFGIELRQQQDRERDALNKRVSNELSVNPYGKTASVSGGLDSGGYRNLALRQLIFQSSQDDAQKNIGIGILQKQQERNDLYFRQARSQASRFIPAGPQKVENKDVFNRQHADQNPAPARPLNQEERARLGDRLRPFLKRATGGPIPGSGFGDSVPTMLAPGEFVMSRNAAQAFGYGGLARMNYFANGGEVDSLTSDTSNKILAPLPNQTEPSPRINTEKLDSSFSTFDSSIQTLVSGLSSFNEKLGGLAKAFESFPSTLEITGSQSINVTFNGAETLASFQGEFRNMAERLVKEQINKVFKERLPDAGVNLE